ncbi:Target of rapamycin complex 2 subunit bit61 [Talaromyces pinophilus]|nr:Target of rapamycin complex 2 subunit bit61 [Talaromyces pinophilus]
MHQSPVSRPDSRAARLDNNNNNNNNARYQTQHQSPQRQSHTDRPSSSDSDASSVSSRVTTLNRSKGPLRSLNTPSSPHPPRTSSFGVINASANSSNVSLPSTARQTGANAPLRPPNDPVSRKPSPRAPLQELQRHRPRQHSQGFFEPSLPTASLSDHTMTALSASQIAAQAAMQSTQQHVRHRSQTVPIEEGLKGRKGSRDSPPPAHLAAHTTTSASTTGGNVGGGAGFYSNTYQNGLVGSRSAAAATAANIAFPRQQAGTEVVDLKQKADKTRKKLFSKPHIAISSSRDWIGSSKDKAQSSPSKLGFGSSSGLSRMVSASTTNLTEVSSNNSSMYNLSNASASTVVPLEKGEKEKEKDKEKNHKHHFLSRQKLKLKEEHRHLPLSSANSNSKPLDPNAPQSLYSFAPSSPGPSSSSFPKSGLDLLHGGRALREKRREEKAMVSAYDANRDGADSDWPLGPSGNVGGTATPYGNPSLGNLGSVISNDSVKETLQGFGLHNMTAEDVWDFLKAKLLVIFDGGDVRIAVEDLNKLVVIHIQLCVQKHMPTIVEDLRELLNTGFSTLNHSISGIPDEKLVPHLMQIWMLAFGTILPFIQAVFLPLDLEFKGRGSVMNAREAREFWGALPTNGDSEESSLGDELDVRMIVLTAFRDTVILQRYEGLNAVFSRLSLDTINATIGALSSTSNSSSSGGRPGTAASLDPTYSSFNSQQSSLLNIAGSYSSDSASANRSRAASNTSSNPDQLIFQSFTSPSQRQLQTLRNNQNADSSHVITDTVGRMLQCFSVLASIQSGDQAQERIEALTKTLKHNWLGRGRTGRDRRGFVGTKVKPVILPRQNSDDSSSGRVTMTNGSSNGNTGWRNSLIAGGHRNMGVGTVG